MTDMLKKSEKINTSTEYVKSDNLTEQWKKGELPSGFYYTRGGLSKHIYIDFLGQAFFEGNIEVIEKVPTFDEYQKLLSDQLAKNEGEEINADLEAENAKLKEELSRESYKVSEAYCFVDELKELLKECKELFVLEKGFMVKCIREEKLSDIIAKIDEVLK